MRSPVNVICAKWGTRYGSHYVNRLRAMVARHLSRPHRFVCFTDDAAGLDDGIETRPMPDIPVPLHRQVSPWRKLALLANPLADLAGPTLFLDLDLVIVDSIDPFFETEGRLCIIENWTTRGRGIGNSSVFRFDAGSLAGCLDAYLADPDGAIAAVDNEQIFLSRWVGRPSFFPASWCRSFKFHCIPGGPYNILSWFRAPRLPPGTRIVVFHGNPKPEDAVAGRWPGKPLKHLKPSPWIAEHWR